MALPTNRTVASTEAEHVADHNTIHTQHNELEGHAADTSVHGFADGTVLATDAEVTAAVSTHAGLSDPHTGYVLESAYVTPAIALGATAAAGAANSPIRSDATIDAFDTTDPAASAFGDVAAVGVINFAARRDHKHAREANPVTAHEAATDPHTGYLKESVVSGLATPAIVLGSSAAAGSTLTPIRSDATIAAFDATVPTTQAFADAAAVGTAAFAARRDHKHAMPAGMSASLITSEVWTSYTPTLTQSATVTKTVTYARYIRLGRLIICQGFLSITGAGTAANAVLVGLPVAAAFVGSKPQEIGNGTIWDVSLSQAWKGHAILNTASIMYFRASGSSGGVLGSTDFVAALANTDEVGWSVMYEAAT